MRSNGNGVSRHSCAPRRTNALHLLVFVLVFLVFTVRCSDASEKSARKSETATDEDVRDYQDQLPANVLVEEGGLVVLSQVEHIPEALLEDEAGASLLVVALYSPTCQHSQKLLDHMSRAHRLLKIKMKGLMLLQEQKQEHPSFSTIPVLTKPKLAKLDITNVPSAWLQTLDITHSPQLLWFGKTPDGKDVVWLSILGRTDTPEDLYETIFFAAMQQLRRKGVLHVDSVPELDAAWHVYGETWVWQARRVLPAVHVNYTIQEQESIAWLHTEETGEDAENALKEPFVAFVQCRNEDEEGNAAYQTYDRFASVLATRRDVAFFAISNDCGGLFDEGSTVMAYSVPQTVDSRLLQGGDDNKSLDAWRQNAVMVGSQLMMETLATPSMFWFDREIVAPVAFDPHQKVHAVLFVPLAKSEEARAALRQLRQACRQFKFSYFNNNKNTKEDTMMCLVVPHTERRILATFGVDPWTPLDVQLTQEDPMENIKQDAIIPALPTLLVTDQRRSTGTQKYYLDANSMYENKTAVSTFLDSFWEGRLEPYVKSSTKPSRRNKSGVIVVTGKAFENVVLDQADKHTLLLMFAPTCGHCKRFSIVWNQLAQLITYLEWDSFLDIAKLDVTENEVLVKDKLHLDVPIVPDVYYFPKGNEKHKAIRYDVVDIMGDGAGRLKDPLAILDWLLDVSTDTDLDEALLLSSLLGESDKEVVDE